MYKAMLKSNDRSENDQNFESDIYIGDDCIIKDNLTVDNITCLEDIQSKNANITTNLITDVIECNNVQVSSVLSLNEIAKSNIIDGDNYILLKSSGLDGTNKRNQFLRFRSGGNPTSFSGLCFSGFDSNHLRFYQSGTTFFIGRSTEVSTMPSNSSFSDNVMSISSVTGSIGIGTASINASALLELTSTSKAFLPPKMNTTERNAIASPVAGLVLYDTTLNSLCTYNGTAWIALNQNLSSSFIRLAKTANQGTQGAITFNDNIINGSDYSFTSGGSTLTINTTGYYKVEASFTYINTAQEKEIYLNFGQLTPSVATLCFSIDSCGTYDAGTTYSNSSISDILLLTAGRTYNFSYSSQTGTSSTLYSTSRAHLTRIT
jgi:hypothetical protein